MDEWPGCGNPSLCFEVPGLAAITAASPRRNQDAPQNRRLAPGSVSFPAEDIKKTWILKPSGGYTTTQVEKIDLLRILEIVNRYGLVEPKAGGPYDEEKYISIARISRKLARALDQYDVVTRPVNYRLSTGVLTLWEAAPGSRVDALA